MKLLEIEALKVAFPVSNKLLEVVRGIDLWVDRGEVVGVLGESGSGKSVTAAAVSLLNKGQDARITATTFTFDGTALLPLAEKILRTYRGKRIAYVFQNPAEMLVPLQRIGQQMSEVFKVHHLKHTVQTLRDLLVEVGIQDPELILGRYPYQLSGGEAQRVMIAMAIALKPDLLIADEPTSAIDASLKDVILQLLKDVNQREGTAILIITHDFDVAIKMCQRVYILYGGLVMEQGPIGAVLKKPIHPYTEALIHCVTSLQTDQSRLYTLEGMAQDASEWQATCPFYDRCSRRREACLREIPQLVELSGRQYRCIAPLGGEEDGDGSHHES